MQLPAQTPVSDEALRAIATRYCPGAHGFTRLPEIGIFNSVFLLGDDLVLRVPRDDPIFRYSLEKEVIAVPAARAAGVRTPPIIAFDAACDLLPVPFIIYERVHGEALELLKRDPCQVAETWRELGRDVGRLHSRVGYEGPIATIKDKRLPDPREQAEALAEAGYVTTAEVRWLLRWLKRLAPAMQAPQPRRFLHGDLQATNVIVEPGSFAYRSLIDWGSALWGDAAMDFVGMPLAAVPFLLNGHREIAPLDGDETAEARILWYQLGLALWAARREPEPARSWGERPLTMLLQILRYLLECPNQRWRDLVPTPLIP
jgi:aminoglycoside phosphotransferase (APT) family kinase protein